MHWRLGKERMDRQFSFAIDPNESPPRSRPKQLQFSGSRLPEAGANGWGRSEWLIRRFELPFCVSLIVDSAGFPSQWAVLPTQWRRNIYLRVNDILLTFRPGPNDPHRLIELSELKEMGNTIKISFPK